MATLSQAQAKLSEISREIGSAETAKTKLETALTFELSRPTLQRLLNDQEPDLRQKLASLTDYLLDLHSQHEVALETLAEAKSHAQSDAAARLLLKSAANVTKSQEKLSESLAGLQKVADTHGFRITWRTEDLPLRIEILNNSEAVIYRQP